MTAAFKKAVPLAQGAVTGLLPAGPALRGGVEGGFIKMAIFLTGPRSTPVREDSRPFGRETSIFKQIFCKKHEV